MNWNSPAEFFAMGGYGLYVWGSFGLVGIAMALEPFLVKRRHTQIVQTLRHQALAEKIEKENP
jgi:heme exporter protein D